MNNEIQHVYNNNFRSSRTPGYGSGRAGSGAGTSNSAPCRVEFENYYFGEVYFDPPIGDVISFVQGIGIVINPLTPGEHMIELHAFFAQDACPNGMETSFDNTWTITVTPQGQGNN